MEARGRTPPSAPLRRRHLGGLIAVSETASAALLDWFAAEGRALPWRSSRDPWLVMVSELMLQQTQVARVVDRLPRFLHRFESPRACALAPLAEVVDEWKGLGYNRRAVNVHRAARVITEHHGGDIPSGLADLLELPGVGAYTARAVRAFAFELDDGVVDTNIGRVLARVDGGRLTPAGAQRLADSMVPVGRGWAWNQAIMELGAMVCRPIPQCDRCPLAGSCRWHKTGHRLDDPATGSAAVSKGQSRFAGSDRQGRGRLVDALRAAPVPGAALSHVMGWPDDPDRARRVAATVVNDGLAVERDGVFSLPG